MLFLIAQTRHFYNGTLLETLDIPWDIGVGQIRLGNEHGLGGGVLMSVAELAVYDRAVTEAERLSIEQQLQALIVSDATQPPATTTTETAERIVLPGYFLVFEGNTPGNAGSTIIFSNAFGPPEDKAFATAPMSLEECAAQCDALRDCVGLSYWIANGVELCTGLKELTSGELTDFYSLSFIKEPSQSTMPASTSSIGSTTTTELLSTSTSTAAPSSSPAGTPTATLCVGGKHLTTGEACDCSPGCHACLAAAEDDTSWSDCVVCERGFFLDPNSAVCAQDCPAGAAATTVHGLGRCETQCSGGDTPTTVAGKTTTAAGAYGEQVCPVQFLL